MKRKLSLFVAGVMMLSMLPAASVFATTKNNVPIVQTSVSTDYTFKDRISNAPVVEINAEDYPESLHPGSKFIVSLTNAEWDVMDSTGTFGGGAYYTSGAALSIASPNYAIANYGGQDKSATKGTLFVNGAGAGAPGASNGATLLGSYSTAYDYVVNFMDTTRAEIVVSSKAQPATFPGSGVTKRLFVPLVIKMKGAGAGTVTVSDSLNSGVSTSTMTFATANEGGVTVSSADSAKKTAGTLTLAEIKIDETVAGKIPMGMNTNNDGRGKYIEFVAPSGFEWQDPTTVGAAAAVSLYGGFSGTTPVFANFAGTTAYPNVTPAQTVASTTSSVKLLLGGANDSTLSRGQMSVSGLVLKKNDASLGEIKVRVTVPSSGTTYVTVGELTKKNISMEVDTTKEMPQIVNGLYSKDATDLKSQVLDIVIKEGVRGAWPLSGEGGDFVIKPNDGVKFRAVEFKTYKGFAGGTPGTLSLNNTITNASTAQVNTANIPNGSIVLKNDKLTFTGGNRSGTDVVELKLRLYVTVKPGYTGDITFTSSDDSTFGAGLTAKAGTAINAFEVKATPTPITLGAMSLKVSDFTIVENIAGGLKQTENDSYYSGLTTSHQSKDVYGDVWMWLGLSGDGFGFNTEGLKAEVVSGDIRIDSIKAQPIGGASSIYSAGSNAIKLKVKQASSTPSTVKISGATVTTNRYLPSGNVELRVGGSAAANSNLVFGSSSIPSPYDKTDWGSFDESYIVAVKDFLTISGAGGSEVPGTGSYTAKVSVKIGSTTMTVNGESKPVSQPAFKKGGVTYVPARATCVALGFRDDQFNYDWTTKTVTIFGTPRGTAQFTVGSEYININGTQQVTMGYGATAQGHNGTTFLPFRALGEIVMNVPVDWDDATQTAYYNK